MGVRGLQYYLEHYCPDACYRVDIQKEVNAYRERTGRDPVLVVDGMGCIRKLYKTVNLEWIFGGEWKEYLNIWKKFVQAFINIGVQLVFFFDGTTAEDKRTTWIKRRKDRVQEIEQILSDVESGRVNFGDEGFQLPTSMGLFVRYLVMHECGCRVFTSVRECDEELAEYAHRNHSFGILAQDSDFVIYNTDSKYFSIENLDLNTLQTLAYDRVALARKLRLNLEDLPLLACLLGNDIVPVADVRDFHCSLISVGQRPSVNAVIFPVTQFLRQCLQSSSSEEVLLRIAGRVFQNGGRPAEALLKKGVESYNIRKETFADDKCHSTQLGIPLKVLTIAKYRHVSCKNVPHVYSVICSLPYESSTTLERFSSTLPNSAILFRGIRKRIYGILFYHIKGDSFHGVPEWCVYNYDSLEAPEFVMPDFPSECLRLEILWTTDCSDDKWRLLAWCLSPSLDPQKLKNIPRRHSALVFLLYSIILALKPIYLENWEIESLIAQAVSSLSDDVEEIRNLHISRISPRAMQLATYFVRGLSILAFTVGTCGEPIPMSEVMPWKLFDGKLFHFLYASAKGGNAPEVLLNHQATDIEEFNSVLASLQSLF